MQQCGRESSSVKEILCAGDPVAAREQQQGGPQAWCWLADTSSLSRQHGERPQLPDHSGPVTELLTVLPGPRRPGVASRSISCQTTCIVSALRSNRYGTLQRVPRAMTEDKQAKP